MEYRWSIDDVELKRPSRFLTALNHSAAVFSFQYQHIRDPFSTVSSNADDSIKTLCTPCVHLLRPPIGNA